MSKCELTRHLKNIETTEVGKLRQGLFRPRLAEISL